MNLKAITSNIKIITSNLSGVKPGTGITPTARTMHPKDLFPSLKSFWKEVHISEYAKEMSENPNGWLPKLERHHASKLFGGYMENRGTVQEPILHLGVDFWLPAGTPVAFPYTGTVLSNFRKSQEPSEWGDRVNILEGGRVWTMKYLKASVLKVGSIIQANTQVGVVGTPEENGGWIPHLHLQCTAWEYYRTLQDPNTLETHAHPASHLQKRFPNPLK